MKESVTMCVIDDIESVVDGITSQINWCDHGIEVIGTALDGEEGLDMIKMTRPEIVLTDIRMPHMDGIEMLAKLKEDMMECKVIFFSGYTDFTYTQQAIRLGAFDYITKPHSLKEIKDIVLKAKEAVQEEKREKIFLHDIKRKVQKSLPVLQQEFFNLLLHHPSTSESVQKRWEVLQIDLEQTDLTVMVIEIDYFVERSGALPIEEVELMRFSLQNIAEETIATCTKGIVFRQAVNRFAVVFHSPGKFRVSELAEKCRENIAKHTKFTVSIGYGRTIKHVSELSSSYQEAVTALSYQLHSSDAQRTMNEVIQYIRTHLHAELTLSECAKQAHLSSNYFANLFKRVTGLTFVQFITQERVEAAKKLLIEGRQVQEIAGDVGYEDRRYFSNVFKRHTGMTPSEFKLLAFKRSVETPPIE